VCTHSCDGIPMQECSLRIIRLAKEKNLPLVLDGDGIALVVRDPDCIRGYTRAVLTPNVVEYGRLCKALFPSTSPSSSPELKIQPVADLANILGNVTIVQKGATDIISDGKSSLECSLGSSPRRCGGQGDVLSGAIATFLSWTLDAKRSFDPSVSLEGVGPGCVLAAFAGSFFTRILSQHAFAKAKRSMTTTDLIAEIGVTFENLFPSSF